MNKCRNPDHPHCTVWVMPGDTACAHGHPQPTDRAAAAIPAPVQSPRARAYLHVSGFDPRAAGGRQAIKLELRGMPEGCGELTLQLTSALALRDQRHELARTRHGGWRPVYVEFSSRGIEHGQHRIEVELQARPDSADGLLRRWACTLVILVPPPGATLGDIHQTFLATHQNVKVTSEDGSIARLSGPAGGRMDIEVSARDASIAQLNLAPEQGKIDVGMPTIAWDEDLIELDATAVAAPHPCHASSACLVTDGHAGRPRHMRLFALDEFVLGRFEPAAPQADLLLAHVGADGPDTGGLTRRLSARHAVIRRGRDGFEIEDVSRFGLLVDGAWPGKHVPVPLRVGMRIEFTASIRGVAVLVVTALHPHAVVLHREDAGAADECFYLVEPERHPGDGVDYARPVSVPLLFHRDGGFWHLDPATGHQTALAPGGTALPGRPRFCAGAYPGRWTPRAIERRRSDASLAAR
jgi:hypothetical protein